MGGRELEEPFRRQRLGVHDRRRRARDRLHAVRRPVRRSVRRRSRGRQPVRHEPGRGRREHRQVSLAFPGRAPRHLGRRHGRLRRCCSTFDSAARPFLRSRRSARSACCSCSIASRENPSTASRSVRCPPSEVPLERASKTQPFPLKPPPLSRMSFSAADIATVTPELEAACRKLIEGMQLGGPYLPVSYNRLRVQFPGNHGGVNWGGIVVQSGAGIPVREHQRDGTGFRAARARPQHHGTSAGERRRQSRASRRSVSGHTGRRPFQHPQRQRSAAVDVPAAAVGPAHAP